MTCPVPGPGDPLVQSLLVSTDCHVEGLVRAGYGALFEGGGVFPEVLTGLLIAYVALIGYRLLLGRSQMSVSDFALAAVKLGAVIALATQWGPYQQVVYRLAYEGPQQVADAVLASQGAGDAGFHGDVFDGLQAAFDDLTAFSPANPPGSLPLPAANTPAAAALAQAAPVATALGPAGGGMTSLSSKGGFDALLLLASALMLLVSSLGLLLATKIVLGVLLAIGPVFIALLIFESTRGLFEGWLRATLGFALVPLSVILLLSFALTLLAPWLAEVETMRDSHTDTPGVAFGVFIIVLVFTGVAILTLVASLMMAAGFRVGRDRRTIVQAAAAQGAAAAAVAPALAARREAEVRGRAGRTAAAVASRDRRDSMILTHDGAPAGGGESGERRITVTAPGVREGGAGVGFEGRIGQSSRRAARPRAPRRAAERPTARPPRASP